MVSNEAPHVEFSSALESAYAYALGMYLGDGCISEARGAVFIRVILDELYPEIVSECTEAFSQLVPDARVTARPNTQSQSMIVQAYSRRWLDLFPQHGRGRKHLRPIVLEPWQQAIVDKYPEQLLRGLIHSDGCRCINRFKTLLPSGRVAEYEYPRYFFSNLSSDIRRIFCDACDRLGIRWTQSNHRNISISHRDSVARLDQFIGPKR